MTEPHRPTVACFEHHCYTHNVDEPVPPISELKPGAQLCTHCGHFFPAGQALVEDFWVSNGRAWYDAETVLDPADITRCAWCGYPFGTAAARDPELLFCELNLADPPPP